MKLKQRMLSLMLSASMLLSPLAACAEGEEYVIPSGEVTSTAISDAYIGGEQINLNAGFELSSLLSGDLLGALLGTDAAQAEEKLAALVRLVDKCTLDMSFYDDFGTARIHFNLNLADVTLLSGTALIAEDGSAQVMTSLTGQLVLAMPAGTFTASGFDVMDLLYGGSDYEASDSDIPFEELPADERLRITATDATAMLLGHLLGWVSGTQMDTNELYTFDDTYLEATDTRDAVAQRMIGKIRTRDFMLLLNNIATTLRDDQGLLQQAIADVLAEHGVTRYQVRQVVDKLLTREEIDPSEDWVQTSDSIPDDGALCQLDDISYFFKKLHKSTLRMLYNNTHDNMSMIVSYDDYGGMVGFDAEVPLINTEWPFEGDFTYSIKTDDNWQRIHTSHGELNVYDNNRVVGDLSIQFGEDVGGLNASHFVGAIDVVDQDDGTSTGAGIVSNLDFTASGDAQARTEAFEGSAALQMRANGEGFDVFSASVTGETQAQDGGFAIAASAVASVAGVLDVTAHVSVESAEYEEIEFAGGEAIDLSAITDEQLERVKTEVASKVAALVVSLAGKQDVSGDLMTLIK